MWHRVEVVLTDVSEERIPSIFRVEGKIRKSASDECGKVYIGQPGRSIDMRLKEHQ
jgi:hypothetical protein